MNFGDVLYQSQDRVATITLNRPERFNAINETIPEDIAAAFDHAGNDDSAHVVVLTGDLINGKKAEEIGLVFQSTPPAKLDDAVAQLTDRIKGVPKNQLMMMKMLVNQAYENMGLANTQTIATLFDGIARHSPEGVRFKQRAEEAGFKQAIAERDSGEPIGGSKS